jgi:esterase/lipase superfamily enzyme
MSRVIASNERARDGRESPRRPSRIAAILLACGLSACATAPVGVMTPIETAPADASSVNMLVVTTRASTNDPREPYSGERGEAIKLDEVVVSIPPARNRKLGEVQWPKRLPPDPERDFATVSVKPVADEKGGDTWFNRQVNSSGRLLVFVHGFNNRFESAVYRLAQITHDSGTGAAPLLFTWPSRGSVFAYGYDKESTNYSRSALESVLSAAAANSEVDEVTLLAHSMGTWLTVESLRQMAIRNGRVPPKIANVILAAPDLDIDVFRQQLADMGPDRPKFTIFVSRDDRALVVSRRLSGNVDRLGQVDIDKPGIRELLEAEGITVLDLSALRVGDSLNHSKFAESPEVVKLLGDRLIAGQAITDQDIGLGAHIGAAALSVGSTVGSAAGLAASVPLSVVDPATRADLDDQADRFGQHLGGALSGAGIGLPAARYVCDKSRQACYIEPQEKGGR